MIAVLLRVLYRRSFFVQLAVGGRTPMFLSVSLLPKDIWPVKILPVSEAEEINKAALYS